MRNLCDATLASIKKCNVLYAIIEMTDFREQGNCITFCFNLRKTATECSENLKTAFGKQAVGLLPKFQWFSEFRMMMTNALVDKCPVQRQNDAV